MTSKLNIWQRIFIYLSIPWGVIWLAKIVVENFNEEASTSVAIQMIKAAGIPAFAYLVGQGVAEIRSHLAKRRKFMNRNRPSR